MNDLVKCNNCGITQIVECGSDQCINCQESGKLSWIDENIQEIQSEPQIITEQ